MEDNSYSYCVVIWAKCVASILFHFNNDKYIFPVLLKVVIDGCAELPLFLNRGGPG